MADEYYEEKVGMFDPVLGFELLPHQGQAVLRQRSSAKPISVATASTRLEASVSEVRVCVLHTSRCCEWSVHTARILPE